MEDMFLVTVTSCIFVNNKLIIGIVIVIIVGIVSLVLSNSYFHQISYYSGPTSVYSKFTKTSIDKSD